MLNTLISSPSSPGCRNLLKSHFPDIRAVTYQFSASRIGMDWLLHAGTFIFNMLPKKAFPFQLRKRPHEDMVLRYFRWRLRLMFPVLSAKLNRYLEARTLNVRRLKQNIVEPPLDHPKIPPPRFHYASVRTLGLQTSRHVLTQAPN
jgi:hypothetical protein